MRFALINNNGVEAQPQLQGLCSCCSKPVIAKCGTRKIWHWAHKSKTDCDNWWESETQWHRAWKDNYPTDWQEVSLRDKTTGEKHIADVKTTDSLVIEFQHSKISVEERTSREAFYKDMVWVVDGTRLKGDYSKFLKGKHNSFENQIFYSTDNPKIFRLENDFLDWCFHPDWIGSSVPVLFDFRGDGSMEDADGLRNTLYCLLPKGGAYSRVVKFSHNAFIKTTINGDWSIRVKEFIKASKSEDEIEQKTPLHRISDTSTKFRWRGVPITRKEHRKRVYKSNTIRKRKR